MYEDEPSIDLYFGDCLELLKILPNGSFDAVVTDPPYGMDWNTDCGRFSGGNFQRAGRDWESPVIGDNSPFDPSPWLRFPKVILFGSNHFAARLPVGTTLVWVKRNEHAYGTFLSDAEIAWMKGGHGVYLYKDLSMNAVSGRRVHPMQKPVALMRWCIEKLKLNPGATIFDPYMGSGTTGVAAAQLGFNFIGSEIDSEYFDAAQRRIYAEIPD